MEQRIIEAIATRAANLLAEWIDLNPLAKSNNGDQSSAGGMAMVLGAMLAAKAPPPPTDAIERMHKHIAAKVTEAVKRRELDGYMWMTFDVDYGPGRELTELATACEIKSSWPIKSCLNISTYRGKVSICDRRGYGAEGLTHYLLDGRGWLVSPSNIDSRILPIVVAAVDRGEVAENVAYIEPFKA